MESLRSRFSFKKFFLVDYPDGWRDVAHADNERALCRSSSYPISATVNSTTQETIRFTGIWKR